MSALHPTGSSNNLQKPQAAPPDAVNPNIWTSLQHLGPAKAAAQPELDPVLALDLRFLWWTHPAGCSPCEHYPPPRPPPLLPSSSGSGTGWSTGSWCTDPVGPDSHRRSRFRTVNRVRRPRGTGLDWLSPAPTWLPVWVLDRVPGRGSGYSGSGYSM